MEDNSTPYDGSGETPQEAQQGDHRVVQVTKLDGLSNPVFELSESGNEETSWISASPTDVLHLAEVR